jgi:hypothetical protein
VRYRAKDGWHEVRTRRVVGADGRSSMLRGLAGLEAVRVEDMAAVQRQREWPVRIVQTYQRLVQSWFNQAIARRRLQRLKLGAVLGP